MSDKIIDFNDRKGLKVAQNEVDKTVDFIRSHEDVQTHFDALLSATDPDEQYRHAVHLVTYTRLQTEIDMDMKLMQMLEEYQQEQAEQEQDTGEGEHDNSEGKR